MKSINARIDELRGSSETCDSAELAGLYYLNRFAGVETEEQISALISYTGADKWAVWAADSMVWTARRLREHNTCMRDNLVSRANTAAREALRGYGQIREYTGRHGGFLPCGLSDHVGSLQNALESQIGPR